MALSRSQLGIGDFYEQVIVENLTRTQLVQYAGASGDYNPLHTDEVFAVQVAGYPSVFAHGMLTMGMTGHMVTDYVGDGRLVSFGGRFLDQVWPGDTLVSRAEVVSFATHEGQERVELRLTTVNQDGREVFRGTAVASIEP